MVRSVTSGRSGRIGTLATGFLLPFDLELVDPSRCGQWMLPFFEELRYVFVFGDTYSAALQRVASH